nr:hypothetical protein [Caballeronia pedi]
MKQAASSLRHRGSILLLIDRRPICATTCIVTDDGVVAFDRPVVCMAAAAPALMSEKGPTVATVV